MTGLRAVVARELRLLFLAPAAWVFLAGTLWLVGVSMHAALAATGEASVRPALPNWIVGLVVCLPPVTARQIAGEARAGTLDPVLASGLPAASVVVGKWIATVGLCALLWALASVFPLYLVAVGDPDPGVLAATGLGLLACSAAFAAAGLLASALTDDPAAATVGGALLLLPGWLRDAFGGLLPEPLDRLPGGFVTHLRPFADGVVDAGAVAWFAGLTSALLLLCVRAVEGRRRAGLRKRTALATALWLLAIAATVDVAGRVGARWELAQGPVVVEAGVREELRRVGEGARVLVTSARGDHPAAEAHDRALDRLVRELARQGVDARRIDPDRDPATARRYGLEHPASVVVLRGDERTERRGVTVAVDRALPPGAAASPTLRWTVLLLPASALAIGGAGLAVRRRR